MISEVCEVHNVSKENCHLWTDSIIVLHWLENPPTSAKIYVASRVADTKEFSTGCTWRHVPTKDNPADLASQCPKAKIVLIEEAKASISNECKPPVAMIVTNTLPILSNDKGELLNQYSSITRLYRITAYVRRFINNCKAKAENREKGQLTDDELLVAETDWLKDSIGIQSVSNV